MEIVLSSLSAKKEEPKAKLHGYAIIAKDADFNEIGVILDFNRNKGIQRAYDMGAEMVTVRTMEDYNWACRMEFKNREINDLYE